MSKSTMRTGVAFLIGFVMVVPSGQKSLFWLSSSVCSSFSGSSLSYCHVCTHRESKGK